MSDMRLPTYRSSYLLRFHPYPRVKLSNREMMTIDDRLNRANTLCDVAEDEEPAELNPLILPDLHEEQRPNVVNLEEAVEVAEADAQPPVRRVSLATLIIDLTVLMARKLSLKIK
ncbi:hypothetical protein K503DRAFT_797446 [Rhizopogon vinicolor AM-OR11-026]|uniref:Uncharacterized protein n=1 Tax=Rhizopogon vinicolor AM-OR11-026 TaxID=1314800 RepID=A0A1B7NB53_9AGAM|nr:hypothetical protein K503DRAFT_797446 [Rhizopogon vinicolor AM-OR11-026]